MANLDNDEVIPSDDEDDMNDHFFFSKDFLYFCNTAVSKRCALKYQLQALKDTKNAVPKIPEKSLISHECASWPAAMYGFFNSIMWAQVINKVMDVKPTLERNTQLEVTLYKKLFESLQNLVSTTIMNSNMLKQLKEKEAARNEALIAYRNASTNMERRIERDQAVLLEDDHPTLNRFQELFHRKLIRLQHLRLIILGLIARGNLNYTKHPEYILMMKEYKKKLTAESIVEAVRVSRDQDDSEQ